MSHLQSPDFERYLGMGLYWTNVPGIGGKLRTYPEDFHVMESFSYPQKVENGRFLIAEVTSKNWETNTLVHELADRLRISQRRISFAGTKDKRSLSTQLLSFENISVDLLSSITIPDVRIQNMFYAATPTRIGDLRGNRFEITVRDINPENVVDRTTAVLSQVDAISGFPNFYGIQRFGVVRPITHIVGKQIVHDDFEGAVMSYIANPLRGESEETYRLRQDLERTRDYSRAFHAYPAALHFEKAILNKLIKTPNDYPGALKELPKNLLMMFVHAYQSFLFNRMLSERLQRGLSMHEAVLGDLVLPVREQIVQEDLIPVTARNIEKVNRQLKRHKGVVTGLLVGSDASFATGEMGDIEHAVVEQEKIDPRDFIIPDIPFLSSSGSRRALLAMMPRPEWSMHPDEVYPGRQALTLQFQLQKGCYATSFLREIMKADNPKDY